MAQYINKSDNIPAMALQGFGMAGEMQQNQSRLWKEMWDQFINAKMQRQQIKAQKHIARKQNEQGWASIGVNAATSLATPFIANSLAAPFNNKLLDMLAKQGVEGGIGAAKTVGMSALENSRALSPVDRGLSKLNINFDDITRRQF